MKIEVEEDVFKDMIETIEALDEGFNCQELTNKARIILRDETFRPEESFSPEC